MKIKFKFGKEIRSIKTLRIVTIGSISSTYVANGKTIPVLIVDTTEDREIEKALLLHKGIGRGKVLTSWAGSFDEKQIILCVDIIEPSPIKFKLIFEVVKNCATVDLIVNSQLLYIQPGKQGDKLKTTMSAPRIQIEVPSTHFYNEWYRIYEKNLIKYFCREKGLSKEVAKQATIDLYKEIGQFREFRMK
ncbi:hypothetical protein [Clostridium perfringens]|uniref:hypothetical protein n=1 Tax=Clostridium perfringens TaxID=1502 RepID=UPI0039ED2214